jgi:glycosyltransferase involved in cell wall biosynthesis
MKIGIIGTRGIPNEYGGFEQFAEDFAVRMVERGHDVVVYSSHKHSYQKDVFKGVKLIHRFDPEYRIGTAGQFIYDFNCIRDSRKRNFDVILQLGYTSSTIWSWLFPESALLVTNMDGLEWKRSKYNKLVQRFLRVAEKWGVKNSDHLIADSPGIQKYLASKYHADSTLVAYGADPIDKCDDVSFLDECGLNPGNYDLLIARFESENNIATVLEAHKDLPDKQLVLVGRFDATPYGRSLKVHYGSCKNIKFLGAIFDRNRVNTLRFHSRIYYHGHSVGGTNPSLVEAMACSALICANDNDFNRAVLKENAWYFKNVDDIKSVVAHFSGKERHVEWILNNRARIESDYSWDSITDKLENCFQQWLENARVPHHVNMLMPGRG